ncbi:MAG TPA: LacI family DNA-binding transcriptional regulator [Chloroflexota bacterium]|jgi:DNA-binding LacI/PurR family transcriptional regulator|nr:LacI family DNA-binding transcriptional regulator [Chloroflexota bacterium]
MKHIGEMLGVSQSTVSRVLSGASMNVPVAPETRERILRLVAELGYTPNPMARALSTARTGLLGLIVRDINDPFFGLAVAELTAEARRHGYSVVLGHVGSRADEAIALSQALAMGHCDGVILLGDLRDQSRLWLAGAARGMPLVGLWQGGRAPQVAVVNVDNQKGVALAVEHIVDLGHRRIAFLQGGRTGDGLERQAAFVNALRARGFTRPEQGIHVTANEFLAATRSVETLLRAGGRPTAIIASTDVAAIGALKAASLVGVRVPEQLSIVGFDDIPLAEVTVPSLTTVHQPMRQLSQLAIERLLQLIANPSEQPGKPQMVQPKLVVRGSTAAPPRSHSR